MNFLSKLYTSTISPGFALVSFSLPVFTSLENIHGCPLSTLRLIFLFKIMLFMAQSYLFSCQATQNVPNGPKICQFGCKTRLGKMFDCCTFAAQNRFKKQNNKCRCFLFYNTRTINNMDQKEVMNPENEMNINADADIPGNSHLSNEGAEDI